MQHLSITDIIHTPIGWLTINLSLEGITKLEIVDITQDSLDSQVPVSNQTHNAQLEKYLIQIKQEITKYFFDFKYKFQIPLAPQGTVFQKKIWQALRSIEPGKTISYSEFAQECGAPNSVRAIANAIGQNPIAIIIPCHRVIGKNGDLTGYAGGLDIKKQLLLHEKITSTKEFKVK